MTDTRADIPSVVERMRPLDAEAPVVAAHFLGQTAIFVLGEEALLFVPRAGEARRVSIHGGAVLSSAADASRIVTGGDDGKVMATDAEGKSIALATDAKHRWIDHVAVGPAGAIAWLAWIVSRGSYFALTACRAANASSENALEMSEGCSAKLR